MRTSREAKKLDKFREGDFIETNEGLIFDVKGLIHPPERIIAFVRYIPSLDGERERNRVRYRKIYDLDERSTFLKKNYPQYLVYDSVFGEVLEGVPVSQVIHHYQPIRSLAGFRRRLNPSGLEQKLLEFVAFIAAEGNVSPSKIGVSGSFLVGLSTSSSDLDLIIYGLEAAQRINQVLVRFFKEGGRFRRFNLDLLMAMHRERCRENGVAFEDYVFHEERKPFQGFFDGVEFFVRYVRDWGEIGEAYGESLYTPMGRVKVKAVVVDDSDSLFTPCSYCIDDVEVVEGFSVEPIQDIVSFRGRFCQQAFTGERVVASGKLERVESRGETYHRLVLGNRPEDFMVVIK